MKGDPEQRALLLGEYIVEHGATVRAAARAFGCSKSTVHKDVSVRLRTVGPELFRQVQMVLDVLILLAAFGVTDPWRVALSVLGAVVLNLALAINHRPGRYMAV